MHTSLSMEEKISIFDLKMHNSDVNNSSNQFKTHSVQERFTDSIKNNCAATHLCGGSMGAFFFPIATIAAFDKITIGSRWPTQRLALFGSELNRLAVSTSWLMQSETADVSTKKSIYSERWVCPTSQLDNQG